MTALRLLQTCLLKIDKSAQLINVLPDDIIISFVRQEQIATSPRPPSRNILRSIQLHSPSHSTKFLFLL